MSTIAEADAKLKTSKASATKTEKTSTEKTKSEIKKVAPNEKNPTKKLLQHQIKLLENTEVKKYILVEETENITLTKTGIKPILKTNILWKELKLSKKYNFGQFFYTIT